MNPKLEERYQIDILAAEAGGYVRPISEEDKAFINLLFNVCKQFGVNYYDADEKDRYFVEEVTRVAWARKQEKDAGVEIPIHPAFP